MLSARMHLSILLAVAVTAAVCSTGGAVAGSLITGAQIKDGTVTGVDVRNGSLRVRDVKPADRALLRGRNGKDGASAFAAPPKGTRIVRAEVYSAQVRATQVVRVHSELPFRAARPFDDVGSDRNLSFGTDDPSLQDGEYRPDRCPGTVANPTAAPGNLCVYLVSGFNLKAEDLIVVAGLEGVADADDRTGFYLLGTAVATRDQDLSYVWAYTAP